MKLRCIFLVLLLLLAAGYFVSRFSLENKKTNSANVKKLAQISPPVISSVKRTESPSATKAARVHARQISFLRHLPAEDVVVLSETTNGVTTATAPDYWQLATTQEKLDFLSDETAANGPLASSDILALFQNEKDPAVLDELLSYATLPDYDANIQSVFSLALRPDQPADLRLAALAYAVDADPSIAIAFQNDANPDLRLEARSLLNSGPLPQAAPMRN